MKKFFDYFERLSSILIVGFLLSFGISSAIAIYTPSEAPGDPYTLISPSFNALLIGSGTSPTSSGDLKVTGNSTVVGDVIVDTLDSYSGGAIDSKAPVTGKSFGDIYYASGTGYTTVSTGVYSTQTSCLADDLMMECTGYLTSPTSTKYYYGSIATKSTTSTLGGVSIQYFCKAYASTTGVKSQATCWSPTDSQGTNSSSI